MTKQVLELLEITCSDGEDLNKVSSIVRIEIIKDVKIAEVISKSICNTISQSRSKFKLTQSGFKLIKFGDSRKNKLVN